jgi:hypothetical protein
MTFIEALYGSQYREITQNGKDGAKGRLNGNIFLSVFIVLIAIVILMILIKGLDGLNNDLTKFVQRFFGNGRNAGKTVGKLLAIPLFAFIYLIISKTIGNKANYEKIIERFNNLPEEVQKQANKKILIPFFIFLGILMFTALF